MTYFPPKRWGLLIAVVSVSVSLACGDGSTTPDFEPELNPALQEVDNTFGFGANATLEQGSAPLTGPDGIPLDATAQEFIQQLTFADGTTLRSSGISVKAVPDESVTNAPFHSVIFGAVNTGSLASVGPGGYAVQEIPEFDFITDVPPFGFAGSRVVAPGNFTFGGNGEFVIEDVSYVSDVFPCNRPSSALLIDTCEFQIGVVTGFIEFRIPAADGSGDLVQERQPFTLPIKRETIIARRNSSE